MCVCVCVFWRPCSHQASWYVLHGRWIRSKVSRLAILFFKLRRWDILETWCQFCPYWTHQLLSMAHMYILSAVSGREVNLKHTNIGWFWVFPSPLSLCKHFLTLTLVEVQYSSFCMKVATHTHLPHSPQTNTLLPPVSRFRADGSLATVLRGGEFPISNYQQVKFYLSSISLCGYGAENCRQAAALMAHS